MKYFSHDSDVRRNSKVRRLIKAHGMQGYGVWWALIEELATRDRSGFQICADKCWLEDFAEDTKINDHRIVIRIFDTLAELNLISRQLWEEGVIFCQGLFERGDAYMKNKAKTAERKRKQRARESQQQKEGEVDLQSVNSANVTAMSRVTLPMSQGVTPAKTDPYTDPDPEEDQDLDQDLLKKPGSVWCETGVSHSDRPPSQNASQAEPGTESPQPSAQPETEVQPVESPQGSEMGSSSEKTTTKKKSKSKLPGRNAKTTEIYASLAYLSRFERFWEWYCSRCNQQPVRRDGSKPSEGRKHLAAIAWRDLIEPMLNDPNPAAYERFKAGCRKFDWRKAIPHAENFIKGGYWESALLDGPAPDNEFLVESDSDRPCDAEPNWVQNPENAFVAYLARYCLPERPEYRGGEISVVTARAWCVGASCRAERMPELEVYRNAYERQVEERSPEGEASDRAIAQAESVKPWEQMSEIEREEQRQAIARAKAALKTA